MGTTASWNDQQKRNADLIAKSKYMKDKVESSVLPLQLDIKAASLTDEQVDALHAIEIESARTAIRSLGSLSKIGEVDHLGGGLDLLPSLLMTLALTDYDKVEYTIEHAHTSIGYYSALASLGFIDPEVVVEEFRRSLDIPGHVSWVPGGTQLNGGRLGVMIPVAVGQALGMKARKGKDAWVICHLGDAGWISGQALNGFNGADLHDAPVTFIMHRNGIQLSDSNKNVMDKDPRPIVASMGIEIIEIESLLDPKELFGAYKKAKALAEQGRPSMIYPTGKKGTLAGLAETYSIQNELKALADANSLDVNKEIWIPGSLMSYRDVTPMLECVLLVNDLPGGKDHHDGHLKGREEAQVLDNNMLKMTAEQTAALEALKSQPLRKVTTTARPAIGTENLVLSKAALAEVSLPEAGKVTSARAGSEAAYAAIAKAFPDDVFIVSADLDPSTKLGKARSFLADDHQFEMSIEEQVCTLMTNGLAMSGNQKQLNVFSTFAAFYEGIAREGFEAWRYQRNLNGSNEGLNVVFHMSHVGACTGRDHFSGWSLDWITLGMGYLPYIRRMYAPCDARSAFVAVRDAASAYGGHLVNIPRDNLPVLEKQDGSGALFNPDSEWEAVTNMYSTDGADKAVLAFGATAFIGLEAAKETGADAYVINGLPLAENDIADLVSKYPGGLVTVEDGIIATPATGLRGFASMVAGTAQGKVPLGHVGITDPRIAPAEGHMETWEHFGITAEAIKAELNAL
jgi:transketolase